MEKGWGARTFIAKFEEVGALECLNRRMVEVLRLSVRADKPVEEIVLIRY